MLATPRFYAIVDTSYVKPAEVDNAFRSVVEGGASIVQLRAKGATSDARSRMVERWFKLPESREVLVIINDDLLVASRFPEVGLHVGQDDTPVRECRQKLRPEQVLGLSTHSLSQAQGAMELSQTLHNGRPLLDYFAVGPVFSTQTKPDYKAVGLDLVRSVASLSPCCPWVAIGGINRQNVREVYASGAPAIVSVSDVLQADSPAQAVRELVSARPFVV